MRHGSLFSGIGGFDLAAQWMGWENVFHCEWNPFGQKVLKHYWPGAESFSDITKTDFTKYENAIDIISGGFPCQPFSNAGEKQGANDERYLWPEMLRAVREIKPRWIVGENVYGILTEKFGDVFEEICASLEAEGYEIQTVGIPATAINAAHERNRVWFIAHSNSRMLENVRVLPNKGEGIRQNAPIQSHDRAFIHGFSKTTHGEKLCEFDGVPGRLDRATLSKWRRESIKAYGNAIVPGVAYQIFRAIEQYELTLNQ